MADLFALAGGGDPGRCFTRRCPVAISGVSDSSHRADLAVFNYQRHDVKIDEAICRIKNFHVATYRTATLGERFPVETADALVETFPDGFARSKPKQIAGRIIEVSHAACRIGHDDAFLNGIENG